MKTIQEVEPENILVSYASEVEPPDDYEGAVIVDSGAFTTIKKHHGYPASDEEYLQYVGSVQADWFLVRDYPVSVHEHIDLEAAETMRRAITDVSLRCLAVSQRF